MRLNSEFPALALTCLLIVLPASLSGQTFQAGGGIGIMVPTSDFAGTTLDYYGGQRYGFSTGFSIAGKLRAGFGAFHLVGGIGFASVSNKGSSEAGRGSVEISQGILTFSVGPEYQFIIPASPLTPYIGGTIALNRFSGTTTFQGVARVPSATYDVQAASRFGLSLNAGVLIELSRLLALDVGIGYNLMNVGGKSWTDVNPSVDQRLDTYLSLNDDSDPVFRTGDDRHVVGNSRSISSFQAMVSIMVGL